MLGECRVYKRRTQREVKAASRRLRRMTWGGGKKGEVAGQKDGRKRGVVASKHSTTAVKWQG
jgi:hypothetical protein